MILNRRILMLNALALAAAGRSFAGQDSFTALEAKHGGRLGVAALDSARDARIVYRGDERFPLCSTFKLLVAAAVLANIDRGSEKIDRVIAYGQSDLLDYAPVSRAQISRGGMSVRDLCAAAVELSDNTAGNLLLASVGGPVGLTRYVRSLGDTFTRLDRNEPSLNTAIPGDPRDTTSPSAMLADMTLLLRGDGLSQSSRSLLLDWMRNSKTAGSRIPAGLPAGWRSGDKTGSGENGTVNDVAFIERPSAAPVLIAAYYTGSSAPPAERDSVLAEVARIVAHRFGAV